MLRKSAKISVIGAGSVGSAVAYALVLLRRCERVMLYDRTLARAEGEAWDIADAIPMLAEMDVIPTDRYDDVCDSEIVVVTAGATMKDGETRLQLLERNAIVLASVMSELDRVFARVRRYHREQSRRRGNAHRARSFVATAGTDLRLGNGARHIKAAIPFGKAAGCG